jgi:iron complex outermembrane receptor protein
LAYQLTDDLNSYFSITRGYQSGGYPARPFGGDETFVSFNPQYALNYELGLKGTVGDSLSFAAALFFTDYDDLQLQANDFSDVTMGFITITENSGKAESKGIEVEATWQPTDEFSIQATVGTLDSEYTEVGPNVTGTSVGNTPQLSPELTFLIAPEYNMPLDSGASVNFRASYNYRDEMFGEATNVNLSVIDSRSLVDLNIRYQSADDAWSIALYGKNLTDEVYDVASGTFGGNWSQLIRSNDRREWGLRVEKTW